MIKVLFVCHGNICRSPMAEFLFKDYVKNKNEEDKYFIASAATSSEEIGNPVHYGTKRILERHKIDCSTKTARKIRSSDYSDFDYIVGMDSANRYNLERFFKDNKKIYLLNDFVGIKKDISDPWYTGDFETTYQDIKRGIEALYKYLNHAA